MYLTKVIKNLASLYRLCVELAGLPVARLHFQTAPCPPRIREVYQNFVKPHPKYKVFRNKSLGAALIDLRQFSSGECFVESLRAHGRACAERRRALTRGHCIRLIDRNDFTEEIHFINVSSAERQGRPMDPTYVFRQARYENFSHLQCYGVFDGRNFLVGYCCVSRFGNFAAIERVIGLKNNNGAMYFLITEIVCELIEEGFLAYFMYDTVYGARPGMRDFKRRLGFRPYRAKYSID